MNNRLLIDFLHNLISRQKNTIDQMEKEIYRLKDENQNLKQVAEHQQSVTLDKSFEIKRLKEKNERLNNKVEELAETLSDTIKIRANELKAIVVEEFKEDLKEKILRLLDEI